jgi:transposase InsO family protein
MDAKEREELIKTVEDQPGKRRKILKDLGIPAQTYYKWRKVYKLMGIDGLKKSSTAAGKVWNRLTPDEKDRVIEVAKLNPELSARLIAVKIIDEEPFSVSEPTVFRLLKAKDLITPRPLPEMPAAKEWRHKTTKPDELWQCDGTKLFIVGWGYYNLLPVLDDYSRKILAGPLRPQESGFNLSDSVEIARETAQKEGHQLIEPPKLYTDNGGGFVSEVLNDYLDGHGIKHIYGMPYHPQGRGKIERWNRTIKEKVCLVVHSSPDELQASIDKAIDVYNNTPHEGLKNVTPNDVYAGRQEVILAKRLEKKKLTIERRRMYNLGITNDSFKFQTLQSQEGKCVQ